MEEERSGACEEEGGPEALLVATLSVTVWEPCRVLRNLKPASLVNESAWPSTGYDDDEADG